MKNLAVLLCFLFVGSAMADTTELRRVLFDGSDDMAEVNMTTEKTRTEYRTVRVPSTCYRQVIRRECHNRGPICTPNNGCRPGGVVCRDVIRHIPYSCMRTETRAVQVHDYFVETTVKFQFNNRDVDTDAYENFQVKVTGEVAKLSVNSSKNYAIVLDKELRRESQSGGVKYVDLTYKVNFISASKANSVLKDGIRNVKLRSGILSFTLGAGFNLEDFSQQIRIFQNRRIGRDTLILDKYLSSNETNVQTTSNASNISINLNDLGVNIPSKLRVILDTKFDIDTNNVINRDELKLDASANWIFR